MYEYKFKKFDFNGLLNFVFNLVDYYRLTQIKFTPDKRNFFDEIQLTHISPNRTLEDKRGFVWAWAKKQDDVRKVSFDQFSIDNKRKVNITINLDEKSIKLNSVDGISTLIIEDLIEENFGGPKDTIIDKRINILELRLSVQEFFSALFFSVCFTLIFAIIRIQNIYFNWGPVFYYFGIFFGITLLIIYIILPIIEIVKKVGLSTKEIFSEFVIEFKRKTKLNKFKTILAIILGLISVCQFLYWLYMKVIKPWQ